MAVTLELPPEVDPGFYRRENPDLRGLDELELLAHYRRHGAAEGRAASPAATRSGFLSLIPDGASVLEIGPFYRPSLRGDRVDYLDVLTTEELRSRAASLGEPTENIPEITYVSPTGTLSVVEQRYDIVFSSHSLEHQPDLVRHLNEVAAILRRGGLYMVIVPDCRYCIDHHLPRTTIADLVDAHHEGRQTHTLKSVIEHLALAAHNDPSRHWRGDHGTPTFDLDAIRAAIGHWEAAAGGYLDVHAWHFTPEGFREACDLLHDLGLSEMLPHRVYGTIYEANEFCAALRPGYR